MGVGIRLWDEPLKEATVKASDILKRLAPHAVVVGSAARGDTYGDVDMVVSDRGLKLAKKLFPEGWESVFIGHIKTFQTEPPLEVMQYWYGPSYRMLTHKRLARRDIEGVSMRVFPDEFWGWTEGPNNVKR